jgi:hypothetical protein
VPLRNPGAETLSVNVVSVANSYSHVPPSLDSVTLLALASGPLPTRNGPFAINVASQIERPVVAFETVIITGTGTLAPQSPPPQPLRSMAPPPQMSRATISRHTQHLDIGVTPTWAELWVARTDTAAGSRPIA